MARYVLLRLIQLLPVLFLASVGVWLMIYLIPGDPTIALLGADVTPEQLARARALMGLDRPLPVQYALWLGRVVRGDLGVSYLNGLPVTTMLAQRIPVTLQLTVASLVVALADRRAPRRRVGGAAAVVDRPLGDGLQCHRDGRPDILARHPPGPLLRALAPLAPDVGLRALLAGAGARASAS